MFYQLLRVLHSSSSTQFWGSVLPSIVKTKDQNSQGCPLLEIAGKWSILSQCLAGPSELSNRPQTAHTHPTYYSHIAHTLNTHCLYISPILLAYYSDLHILLTYCSLTDYILSLTVCACIYCKHTARTYYIVRIVCVHLSSIAHIQFTYCIETRIPGVDPFSFQI